MPDFENEIRTFIVDNFLMGRGDALRKDDSFLEKGIFDSTGILELVSFIENKYSIELEPDELVPENLDSIALLARFLEHKLLLRNPVSELIGSPSSGRSSL